MYCEETVVQAIRTPMTKTLRRRNHTSALNEARRSHFGNSARIMTLYLTGFPGGRFNRTTQIAIQRALRREAREKFEPSDRNRLATLPTTYVAKRCAR